MATYWENSCSFGLRYVSWYKYLIVSLVFSHLGFWSGNLFLIAPFPDLCLFVPFSTSFPPTGLTLVDVRKDWELYLMRFAKISWSIRVPVSNQNAAGFLRDQAHYGDFIKPRCMICALDPS